MDSDSGESFVSQPSQLLQHTLAPAPQGQTGQERGQSAPKNDGDSIINDFSLDSRIIPVRSVTPRYRLPGSLENGGERVLAEDSQREKRQEDRETADISRAWPDHAPPIQGSSSEPSLQGDSPISASIGKVVATRTSLSFYSPLATPALHPPSRPTKSMPVGNRRFRRSPSPPSQDSFGGPISQDPAEQYLASAKQFDVPLSDLGDTPTQVVIHSPTDPEMTLPDASEHAEFLAAAMREYDARKALASNHRGNVLVVATPNNSGESSGPSQHKDDDFSSHNGAAQESRFEFNGSSSFDKMLDRDLADAPDPTPEPTPVEEIEPLHPDRLVDAGDLTTDDILTTPPQSSKKSSPSPAFDWIAPSPHADVASSNPRSLLRMVHPNNRYRIAKMRHLAGDVEPPSFVTKRAETQPMEETQPCLAGGSTLPSIEPTPRPAKVAGTRQTRHQPLMEDADDPEDALDIVPDSEPSRADQVPRRNRLVTKSPLKKPFRPVSPMSEHGSGDIVPDSLEVEESEVDIPLSIEVASKNTKKPAVPAENVAVHGKKTKVPSSVTPAKAPIPVPRKQPQRPTPSTTGRTSRARLAKTECSEIPTSLPEQDLQSEGLSPSQPVTAAANLLPSKKTKRDSETREPCHTRPNSTTRLPTTKSVAGHKRARKADTESSEDSTHHLAGRKKTVQAKIRKEEEDTEYADDDDGGELPPPPPPKPTSRRKKRRTEDVSPTRETSKASTSSRNNPSETPATAVATRSAKRLRSGVSSVRGATGEPATRVFALWKQDGHYYSGVVHSRGLKNKFLIKFDDNTEDEVELKNMRRRELLIGDRVIIAVGSVKGVVNDVSHADSRDSFELKTDNGKGGTTRQVLFKDIRIANRTIQSQWKGRMLVAEDIVTVIRPKPSIDVTPSRQSVTSTPTGEVRRELVKTGLVVTISPKNDEPIQTKDEVMRAIKQHGGLVIEDWSSVFTMEGKHSQSNKRWIATPQDFRWKPEVDLDRVFLLSDDAHQKPKFLLALALGIPCLSFDWLTKGENLPPDWQPCLLPAGYSDSLGARVSQRVDLDWGNCTEHITDIMDSEVPIKLFSQKTVLCVGPELVPLPPSRAKKNNPEEASRYVPWIILCMGAAEVEAITDIRQVTLGHMRKFDYIIVKEKEILGSLKLDEDVVVGDVNWVKDCLVSSRLSPPELG